MATLHIPAKKQIIREAHEITAYLAAVNIQYERWEVSGAKAAVRVGEEASTEEVLAAYHAEIETLKVRGGYVTADVIDVRAETPNLEAMLNRFNKEHWHDEDEVRFIVAGNGLFHIHPEGGDVVAIEVEAGDLIRVPRGTHHWFDLCTNRRIRAIRLFQAQSGWTPHYTETGIDKGYLPVCFGPQFITSSGSLTPYPIDLSSSPHGRDTHEAER